MTTLEIETPKVEIPWGKIVISVVLTLAMYFLAFPVGQILLQTCFSSSLSPWLSFSLLFLLFAFLIGTIFKDKIIRYGLLVLVVSELLLIVYYAFYIGIFQQLVVLECFLISFFGGILLSALANRYSRKTGVVTSVIFAVLLLLLSGYALFVHFVPAALIPLMELCAT